MGLPGRADLSQLLTTHFTRLATKNTGDMKWKKFFYKQLCDESGLRICRAPSCSVCDDYSNCFGAEDGPLMKLAVTT
jgi:nitrogen fixation protein NifQ